MNQLTSTSMKYLIRFKDGSEYIIGANQASVIDKLWDESKKRPELTITIKGKKTLMRELKSIDQLKEDPMKARMAENMQRLEQYTNESNIPKNKKQIWLDRIKENIERKSEGKEWIYYDKDGNVSTKEEVGKWIAEDNYRNKNIFNQAERIFK